MKGRVIIVHGYNGQPEAGWLGWLAGELAAQGYEVINPAMPARRNPVVGDWVKVLKEAMGKPDKKTVILAHSMGCNVAMSYLSELGHGHTLFGHAARSFLRKRPARLAGLIVVSGFYASPGDKLYGYFGPVPDFKLINSMTKHRICIYSDNDHIVKPEQSKALAEALDAKTIELHKRGHMVYTDGANHPELLAAIQDCFK